MLIDSIDAYGHLSSDHAARDMLTHRNTLNQDIEISPVEMLYDRTIKDHFPILREKYQGHRHWREMKKLRESTMVEKDDESKAI